MKLLSTISLLALFPAAVVAVEGTTVTTDSSHRFLKGGGGGSKKKPNMGNGIIKCISKKVITSSWESIKLSPENEVEPFMGVPYAFGTADFYTMTTDVNMCSGPPQHFACITTDIEGFVPKALHIHKGEIFENGNVVVDFTPLLDMSKADIDGCVQIMEEDVHTSLINEPELHYVNAHLGGDPPTILQSIRGQFVQSVSAELENTQTIAPFNMTVEGASGMAKVSFEAAGTVACFDVSIMEFDPALGHVHTAVAGTNGPRIFNYSDLKVGPGRFFGCKTIADLNVTVVDVAMILKMPQMYYFDYHLTGVAPEIFTSIRGQFPMN